MLPKRHGCMPALHTLVDPSLFALRHIDAHRALLDCVYSHIPSVLVGLISTCITGRRPCGRFVLTLQQQSIALP